MEMTIEELETIVSRAKGKALELGIAAGIAILNADGNLVALHGTGDGNPYTTVEAFKNAQRARNRTRFDFSWQINWRQAPMIQVGQNKTYSSQLPQGVPIFRNRSIIGFIGVSSPWRGFNFSIAAAGAAFPSGFAFSKN